MLNVADIMIEDNFWFVFIGAAISLNIIPGPDVLYILTKTMSAGKKIGIASSLRACTGALFHVFLVSMGLSAIIVTSAVAFTLVKLAGACYLFYLAFQTFYSLGSSYTVKTVRKTKESLWKAFKQGVLIDIFNPKVAIFFMAFLPHFLREGKGSTSSQLMHLGIIVVLIAFIIEAIYVILASKFFAKFHEKKYSVWIDKIAGTVFIGLGVMLVMSANI